MCNLHIKSPLLSLARSDAGSSKLERLTSPWWKLRLGVESGVVSARASASYLRVYSLRSIDPPATQSAALTATVGFVSLASRVVRVVQDTQCRIQDQLGLTLFLLLKFETTEHLRQSLSRSSYDSQAGGPHGAGFHPVTRSTTMLVTSCTRSSLIVPMLLELWKFYQ